jgi:hypothetical protein
MSANQDMRLAVLSRLGAERFRWADHSVNFDESAASLHVKVARLAARGAVAWATVGGVRLDC